MELAGLSLHAPSRQQSPSHSGASSSSGPRPARTLRRTTQIDRDTVPRFASATETSEPAANLSPPRLNTVERERLQLHASDSPQLMRGRNRQLERHLDEWENKCLQNTNSWAQEWQESIRRIGEVETNPAAAVQSTKHILKAAARPGSNSLRVEYSALPHLPSDLSHFTHLNKIDIRCTGLQSLPDSIGQIHNLRELTLINNPVKDLPHSLRNLSQLESLEIIDCKQFETLPSLLVNVGRGGAQGLTGLKNLSVRGSRLTRVPDCVTYMPHLEQLDLKGTRLRMLPPNIKHLGKLQELNLERTQIQVLQPEVCELPSLKKLHLKNCVELRALPSNLGQLRHLEELDLRGCNNLDTLPQSIRELPGNCTIRVPQHLQNQLDPLRPQAGRAARATTRYAASSSTGAAGPSRPQALAPQAASNEASRKKITNLAYAALYLIDNNKNPFMADNPPIDPPSESNDDRMQLGEIPAVATMIQESNNRELRNIIKGKNGKVMEKGKDSYYRENEKVTNINLSSAVNMWRSREMIAISESSFRNRFPELELHISEQTQTDANADPQPARD
ncbi:type III secretion system leucine-rich repeat domain-containing effector XopL [Xanthomonas translucens]|uniref:type III secretion system leucine-rich repeat domain-containing effector XopL n=1 Tax=Xanthomonas campestris pv. translucens TaxID=343 RepID=UPI0018C292AB|nr:type III secretion system leucine-rich repeat domain-containing effector XopL [Xanthomonas translucens]